MVPGCRICRRICNSVREGKDDTEAVAGDTILLLLMGASGGNEVDIVAKVFGCFGEGTAFVNVKDEECGGEEVGFAAVVACKYGGRPVAKCYLFAELCQCWHCDGGAGDHGV